MSKQEKLKQKINREISYVETRYGKYTEKEILALILFELRGVNYKMNYLSDQDMLISKQLGEIISMIKDIQSWI